MNLIEVVVGQIAKDDVDDDLAILVMDDLLPSNDDVDGHDDVVCGVLLVEVVVDDVKDLLSKPLKMAMMRMMMKMLNVVL